MKRIVLVGGLAFLAGCGTDGEPVKPTADSSITLSNNGVSVATNLRLNRGPFTIGLGVGS